MGMTILNQKVENAGAIEQIVNAVIELAKEQNITPDTDVDVDHPLTLGAVEFEGLHTETHPEPEMTKAHKPDEPGLN